MTRSPMNTVTFGLLCSFLFVSTANAYQFVPTDSEWESWSPHCKAKYVWTDIGQRSKFVQRVTDLDRAELKKWEDTGIVGLHHYCTGTLYLQKARLEGDVRRGRLLRSARDETEFTFANSNKGSPLFAPLASQLATILYEQGELQSAIDMLESVLREQPNHGVLYSALAVIQWKQGNLSEAKQTLLRGNDVLEGKSAEIYYNLGLISLELDQLDEAVKYAELAYGLGFPLPGLRAKLKRMGHM